METDKDFEGDLDILDDAKAFDGVFHITYEDADLEQTVRTIDRCRRLVMPPHEYILAHCHLRDDERLFRLDRIQEIVDGSTGEQLHEFVGSRVGVNYEPILSAYPADDPLRAARFDLDVLTFVASLSSKMRDSQVKLIVDYLAKHVGVTSDPDLLRLIKRHLVPGPENFRQAMKAVPQERAAALLAVAAAVLTEVRRDGDLDRGILAMLEARKAYIGRYVDGR